MKPVKKIVLTLVILIIFTGLAIWALTLCVTPNAINELINKELRELTQQKSHIDGNIAWHLLPRPGIKVTQIRVGEVGNKKANYSVSIENLHLNLQLSPLLRGRLVFNELMIDGFKIYINPEEQTNTQQNNESESNATPINTTPSKMSAQFAIDNFLLTHGQLVMVQAHNKITFTGLQIRANQLNLKNEFFPLQVKSNINAAIAENKINAAFNYKGRIRLASSTLTEPLVALQHAGLDGQLLIQNLRYNQIRIAKISSNMKIKQNEITFNPFNLSLYSGKSVGDLNYQFNSKKLSINQTAIHLDAHQISNELFAKNIVNGNLDFSLHATTNLQNPNWQKNIHGNGNLTIKDGVLYFIDINKYIDEATNKIHSLLYQGREEIKLALLQPLFKSKTYPQGNTKFQLLNIQYRLLDTKINSDALLLQTDKLQLKGSGEVNLTDATQDLQLSAKLIGNDSTVDKIQQLLGGSFPLKVCGTLTEPQILPTIKGLNPIISAYLLKNTIEAPITQIQNRLGSLLSFPDNLFQDNKR